MRIGVRLALGFGLVLSMMMVAIAVGLLRLASVNEVATKIIREDWIKVELANTALHRMRDNARRNLELLVTTDSVGLEKVRGAIADNRDKITENLNALSQMFQDEEGKALFAKIKSAREAYVASFTKVGKLVTNNKREEATKLMLAEALPLLDAVVVSTRELVDLQKSRVDEDAVYAGKEYQSGRSIMLVLGVVALFIGVIFSWFITRSITRPIVQAAEVAAAVGEGALNSGMDFESNNELGILARGFNQMIKALSRLVGQVQRSGIQVSTSVTEIAATAKQQQATASEIAATTSEIGATSREISATSKELVKIMNDVSAVAEQSAELAGNGQAGLSRMEETMRHVTEAAGAFNAKLAVLNEKAGNINQVVTTITKVADQTNLLSLNAAIEAEKAGEYGRGFAVVATEIRRLADQTAIATYDIEQMVKEIQSAVSAGVMGMDKFSEEVRQGMQEVQQVGGQLSQIIQQVQAMAPRCGAVNEGMQAQATGAEQISQALAQLSEAAQQTVESLRQSSQTIDELNQVANDLRSGVSRFKVEA
ncbi:MAG: methyl-accepting chemotaxis protein [Gammaproteobacteria bacterium]|nr:methyl-accepting chemotaxis protein [Gammaproteobacteria bacterium]